MRRVAIIGVVALAASCLAAPASGSTKQHRYVGANFHTFATDLAGQATGVMVQGSLDFVPTGDEITVTVDDDVITSRTIHVYVSRVGHRCIPENTPTTISGLERGEHSTIWIMDATSRSPCETGGTTGVLTLTQP